jgi:hypothetical protein
MKFYVEMLHPTEKNVLWHYFAEASTKVEAQKIATDQFIEEQADGILIDTGGLFMVTVEEVNEKNINDFEIFRNNEAES